MRIITTNENGSYTLEATLALFAFTAAMLTIFSIFSVLRIEAEVAEALNETAVEISQVSYVKEVSVKEASVMFAENVDRSSDWFKKQGVNKGLSGIDFTGSHMPESDKDICLDAHYEIKLQTFGLMNRTISINQRAKTKALCSAKSLAERLGLNANEKHTSIWQESNFFRGKYFVSGIKNANGDYAVKSGQGIDLYNPVNGTVIECYSLNIFSKTYRDTEAFLKEIESCAKDFKKDLSELGNTIEMEHGEPLKVGPVKEKIMILIVPEEAAKDEEALSKIESAAGLLKNKYGIVLDVRFLEKAKG